MELIPIYRDGASTQDGLEIHSVPECAGEHGPQHQSLRAKFQVARPHELRPCLDDAGAALGRYRLFYRFLTGPKNTLAGNAS
jgi:hypothetical protein